MPTAASWTEVRRSVADVRHLLRFRTAAVRRPRAFVVAATVLGGLTLAAAVVPAWVMKSSPSPTYAQQALSLLPTALAAFVLVAIAGSVASGGGRELIAREHATIHPISPTTDHLGALLMAPLNIAWLLQAWLLLGVMSYGQPFGAPHESLLAAQIGIGLWILVATAVGQVVAWTVEAVRRTRFGIAVVRTAMLLLAGAGALLQVSGHLAHVLDSLETTWIVVGLLAGFGWQWAQVIAVELVVLLLAVVLGAVPAHLASRRQPREESLAESGSYPARRLPRSPLAGLVRTDRSSVWRAVPMRRGLAVLAVGPGVVALAGNLSWSQMTILPGLVASGGALLFGVNAWCLDSRGSLWRESLPVPPWAVFAARSWVLAEFLVLASLGTLVLAALRAGMPTASELAALVCTWLVVVLQVVSAAMRWSSRRPFAVDLRSARATPAPPLVMVGYSTKLAVVTTVTSLVFSGLARLPYPSLSVLAALPFLVWSLVRLLQARDAWVDPVSRARVVMTVAG